MPDPNETLAEITERRRIEDDLLALGEERARIGSQDQLNRTAIQSWLEPARAVGITVRDISRMTGFSTQTLHAWMRERMKPVWAAHLGLGDPPAQALEEAVLRTIAEDPAVDWTPGEALGRIPRNWPTGSLEEVTAALESLTRTGQIWRTDRGYRLGDPEPDARA